jgi:hypothetical protein
LGHRKPISNSKSREVLGIDAAAFAKPKEEALRTLGL